MTVTPKIGTEQRSMTSEQLTGAIKMSHVLAKEMFACG